MESNSTLRIRNTNTLRHRYSEKSKLWKKIMIAFSAIKMD